MAYIEFVAMSAQIGTGVGDRLWSEDTTVGLSYKVRLYPGESIKLATEENFDTLEGYVTVVARDDSSLQEEEKAVGEMFYSRACGSEFKPIPARYGITIWLSKTQFDELLAAARLGRVPSEISICTKDKGMDYDSLPDGCGKKWDNKTYPDLKLKLARFTVPLVSPVTSGEFEWNPTEELMPPTRSQLDQLYQRVDQLVIETKALKVLFWIVIIISGWLLIILSSKH